MSRLPKFTPAERKSEVTKQLTHLRNEFKSRVELIERDHIRQVMRTYQEFYSRAVSIKRDLHGDYLLEK